MTELDLMLRFMIQAIVVLAACKAMGWIGTRFLGQTQVVMEMVTGVFLGPSLFGVLAPALQKATFPVLLHPDQPSAGKHPSMTILYVIAQIGLVLYMFLVGLEFDPELIRKQAAKAMAISLAGIIAPFVLGAVLAISWLHADGRFFAPGVLPGTAALYMGAAMCITAFPMLARILYERGMTGTSLGTLALGAGATDDAAAWSLLAIVLAVGKGDPRYAIFAIGGGLLFGALMLTVGRRIFASFAKDLDRGKPMSQELFSFSILLLMAGAYFTDAIGIYAVFGAFLMGMAMPKGRYAEAMRERLEAITVALFLPFFFVYSGLNTQIGLISGAQLWLIAIVVLIAAIVGKGVACGLAARWAGESVRDSTAIGVLMNSRGLMELIILNIGLQQKVITPTLFTIMVLMAIVTTLMASPIFNLVYRRTPTTVGVPSVA